MEARVAKSLERDGPDWRLLNSCPCCQYRLADEPPLPHDLLLSLDGGSSLKRFATAGSLLDQSFESSYFLSRENVNGFANEVVHRVRKPKGGGPAKKKKSVTIEDADDVDIAMEIGGDEEEVVLKAGQIDVATTDYTANLVSICVERWKANADDVKKGMFSCYDECGIFIAVCRHGLILVIADMVASGEL